VSVAELAGAVDWCVPGFVESARARKLPGAYKGERFWHGRATVERHRHWVVALPVLVQGTAAVTVGFDGAWAWVLPPSEAALSPVSLAAVQAGFDAALDG
jgi:hypothetical protein